MLAGFLIYLEGCATLLVITSANTLLFMPLNNILANTLWGQLSHLRATYLNQDNLKFTRVVIDGTKNVYMEPER